MISGKKLRISGKGEPSPYGGPAGDLYIKSKVLDNPVYDVQAQDLYINRDIKLSEAILGTNISVPTLSGKELKLKIPAGTKHKTKMRLSGHGLPHMHGKGQGDLYVHIHVNMPKRLINPISIISDLHRSGMTILLVEQNALKALQVADRGYVMETGEIVMADTCEGLLCDEKLCDAYLGGKVAPAA